MGQYFELLNIDKRETRGHLGKVWEFLLYVPEEVEASLARRTLELLPYPSSQKLTLSAEA